MKRGLLGVILAAACVILGVAIVYVDSAQDDNAPTITVGDEPGCLPGEHQDKRFTGRGKSRRQGRWRSYKRSFCRKDRSGQRQ